MKLEDWIALAGLLIFVIGCIIPWPQTIVVGVVLMIIGLVAGSDTLKKESQAKKIAKYETIQQALFVNVLLLSTTSLNVKSEMATLLG